MKQIQTLILCVFLCLNYTHGQELQQVANNPESYRYLVSSENLLQEDVGIAFQNTNSVYLLDFSTRTGSPDTRSFLISQLSYSEVLDWSHKNTIDKLIMEAPDVLKLKLRYKGQQYIMDLVMSQTENLDDPQEEIVEDLEDGTTTIFYHGIIEGLPHSMATLALGEDNIHIWLTSEDLTLEVSPINEYNKTELAIFNPSDAYQNGSIPCMTETADAYKQVIEDENNSNKTSEAVQYRAKCLSLWLEADYNLYRYFKSYAKTLSYMKSLFNMLNTIYKNEKIPLTIKAYKINTSKDRYAAGKDSDAALKRYAKYRKNTGASMNLLLYRNSGYGLGYVNGVKTPNVYNYAVVGSAGSSNSLSKHTWTLGASAHELGHLVGSDHTHDCVWGPSRNRAIDGCGPAIGYKGRGNCKRAVIPKTGTLMSYCDQITRSTYYFGSEPGNRVRSVVNNASIKSSCPSPVSTCLNRYEPNNKWADAKLIYYPSGSYYYAALGTKTDVDWYKFKKGDNSSMMNFKLQSPKGAYYTIQVYNSSKKLLASKTSKASSIFLSLRGGKGYYYVKVASYKSSYSSSSCYSLRIMGFGVIRTPQPTDNGDEINVSSTAKFSLYPNPAQSELSIASDNYTGNVDLRIYDLSGRLLIEKDAMDIDEKIDISELSSGNYIVNIKYEGGEARQMLTHL